MGHVEQEAISHLRKLVAVAPNGAVCHYCRGDVEFVYSPQPGRLSRRVTTHEPDCPYIAACLFVEGLTEAEKPSIVNEP